MTAIQAKAPGRVNLIGEHTDYNAGFVLPTALSQTTRIELVPRGDSEVTIASAHFGDPFRFRLGEEHRAGAWYDYVQGVTSVLRGSGFPIRGFEATISSDVPLGSGLSSSAALEVALFRALREAFSLDINDVAIAKLGQRVENEFVGANCGIMDQMAASLAEPGSALFLDTRDLSYRKLLLPDTMDLVVINSGVAHRHSTGDYNRRRSECEEACRLLGVRALRDIEERELPRLGALPELLAKRARHVVTENARVLRSIEAIERADIATLGALFSESHRSMRDDYEVSIPEIDTLVEIAGAVPAVLGARLTGGGFGGSIVALAQSGHGAVAARQIVEEYERRTGLRAAALVPVEH